jgi:magnesium transporter
MTSYIYGHTLQDFRLSQFGNSTSEVLSRAPFWVNIIGPTSDEFNLIQQVFSIHPVTIEDIQTSDTREKFEVFPNYYAIFIKCVLEDEHDSHILSSFVTSILVFKDFVVSFQPYDNSHVQNVINRCIQKNRFEEELTPEFICYAFIDDITDSFVSLIKYMENDLDSIDELVGILKASEQGEMLQRISLSRKRVMLVSRMISGKPDLIKSIISRMKTATAEMNIYFEDVFDHAYTMKQDVAQFDNGLTRCHTHYLAQINIEITQASNKGNDLVTKMTFLASMLLPMNVVTGLWGMNVPVPGGNSEGLLWFFCIIIGMFVISFLFANLLRVYMQRGEKE